MFCKKCGKKLDDGVTFCSACGTWIGVNTVVVQPPSAPKTNYWGITALILSIVLGCGCAGVIPFIFSMIGLIYAKDNDGAGKGVSFAALLISIFWFLLCIAAVVFGE